MSKTRKKKLVLTQEQMKQLARYEITFRELTENFNSDNTEIICPDTYRYTLEDLTEAIRNLQKKDPTIDDFGENWFYPLDHMDEAFGLNQARGDDEDQDDTPEELKEYDNLLLSDSEWFEEIWWQLYDAWSEYGDETRISEAVNFDTIFANLERFQQNKGKPIAEWIFTEQEMKNYIWPFEKDEYVNKVSEKELELCRRFLNELCAMDCGLALHIKGYACYGGNRLYACDWPASRDCMLRLFEKKDDPHYANTLGYIYYYGRCTGGVPEYEKALHYFEIAAANGIFEGMYKLADMYWHGYGCKKSPRTARALYGMVYEDSYRQFLQGREANFADAALRMGNVFAKGIDEDEDMRSAYFYYLQADYAANLRAKDSDFFGNTTVIMNVQKVLKKTEEELSEKYFQKYKDWDVPYYFRKLCEDNYRCQLTRETAEDGDVCLTACRISTKSRPNPDRILITIGELKYCERTNSFSMTAVQPTAIWFKKDADSVRFDYCTWNDAKDRYEFYYDDKLTAWIRCEHYRVMAPAKKENTGKKYRFASVRFQPNGHTYDYLCDDEDVVPGDTVVVTGYDGETEVLVTAVFTKYRSEICIPMERFKKVLRKVQA